MEEVKKDPVAAAVDEELRKLDGRVVARRLTVNGEKLIVRKDGKDVELALEFPDMAPLPPTFNGRLMEVMEIFYSAVSQINEMPQRLMPLTRNELLGFGATKTEIAKLQELGLLEERSIGVHVKGNVKKLQQRVVVFPTPQGRAYIRSQFDNDYGRKKDAGKNAVS